MKNNQKRTSEIMLNIVFQSLQVRLPEAPELPTLKF